MPTVYTAQGKRVKSAADAVSVVDDCTVGEPITVKVQHIFNTQLVHNSSKQ
jgi:hypothetical protein